MKPPSRRSGADRTPRESRSALLEAAQAAVAEQRSHRHRGPPAPSLRRRVFRALLALIVIGGGVLLVRRPAWLAGPRLPPETPAVRAATARLALVDAVSHVQAFRAATGRLPRALAEAGIRATHIGYEARGGDRFVVRLQAGDSLIVIRSDDSLEGPVAEALRVLRRPR